MCRVALSGVTQDLWSEDNELALDRFIEEASISLMVVYLDPMTGLRVEHVMPSQVHMNHWTTLRPSDVWWGKLVAAFTPLTRCKK